MKLESSLARNRADFAISSGVARRFIGCRLAIVAVAVLLELDAAGRASRVSITLGGVGSTPMRVPDAEARLLGSSVGADDIAAAADCCGRVEALGDPQIPAWYRQRLASTLAARAIPVALSRSIRASRA